METSLCALEVRVHGRPVRELYHDGEIWIEGRKGSDFTIRLSNRSPHRILMVPSIDGLSVMDGKDAKFDSSGYIVPAHGHVDVPGWRLNDSEVAKFRFHKAGKSYAAQSDKPLNIGVIGCAVFREKESYTRSRPISRRAYRPSGGCGQSIMDTSFTCDSYKEEPTNGLIGASVKPSLGTEFGKKSDHKVQKASFDKASSRPNEVMTVRYGDRDELIRRGVDLAQKPQAASSPSPFPAEDGCEPPPGWQK